jgi:hypothetical protein
MEIISAYSENDVEYNSMVCQQSAELCNIKASVLIVTGVP